MAPTAEAAKPTHERIQIQYLGLAEIVPYDKNPRDNSDAIAAVAKSIQDFGFRVPLVLDQNRVIVTGHTRYEAAKRLGLNDIPCLISTDLTPTQIDAFRLVDNKTSELAKWDFDLLAGEVNALMDAGIDLTPYGWASEELDCLREVVAGEDVLGMKGPQDLMGDGVNSAALHHGLGLGHITTDAQSARITVGEFNWFMDIAEYRAWAENVRKTCNYDKQAIVYFLAEKLGQLEAVKDYDRKAVARQHAGTEEALKAHREMAEQDIKEKAERAAQRDAKRKEQEEEQRRVREQRDAERAEKKAQQEAALKEAEEKKAADRAEKAAKREAAVKEAEEAKARAKAEKEAAKATKAAEAEAAKVQTEQPAAEPTLPARTRTRSPAAA